MALALQVAGATGDQGRCAAISCLVATRNCSLVGNDAGRDSALRNPEQLRYNKNLRAV